MATTTKVEEIKFQRKTDGSYTADLNLKPLNVFAQRVELAKLEKQGYTVIPARYEVDDRGCFTSKVWLYRARRNKHIVSIYV